MVAYESPPRGDLRRDAQAVFGKECPVCVAWELTKHYEDYLSGTLAEVCRELADRSDIRREFVVCFGPQPADDGDAER